MKKSKFTVFVENKLIQAVPKKFTGKYKPEHYIKGNKIKGTSTKDTTELCNLKFLNLTMPLLKSQFHTVLPATEDFYSEKHFADMNRLWSESDIFEAKIAAIYWLAGQETEFLLKNHKKILSWPQALDNWAHADLLCSVLARMFEHSQNVMLPVYLKWNSHQNSWLRRCSMVGTFYYSALRTNHPSFTLAKKLVDPHFTAKEYYVQKAVGWTIREMYNVYPAEAVKYIESNLGKLSSVAWVAASEKLPMKIKTLLLNKRRQFRKKST